MGKKGKAETIHRLMPFNSVSGLVKTKTFRVYTSITNILYWLWIDDHNSCPFDFFLLVGELGHVKGLESSQ